MSDPRPLKLKALTWKSDMPWIPPLEQVIIFTKILGYICDREPQWLPKKTFSRRPCVPSEAEEVDEGILRDGIDFLGQYDPNETMVTLNMCRIRRYALKHGFHFEDVITIVLVHELAHFVTHLAESTCGAYWEEFGSAESETVEQFAQEATHLTLRAAGFGHLVHVFDSSSNHCPSKYHTWRKTWKSCKNELGAAVQDFRVRLGEEARPCYVPHEKVHTDVPYDE